MKPVSVNVGVAWITVATFISKLLGLLTQVVLGWMLTKTEFGLYSIILSLAVSVTFLRNGGIKDVLVQRGDEYNRIAPAVLIYSLFFNIIATTVLICIAFIASKYYQEPAVLYGLILVCLSILLSTPVPVLIAKLSIESYFNKQALISIISGLFKAVVTIILAVFGLGIYSILLPFALEPLLIFILLMILVRERVKFKSTGLAIYKELYLSSKWIMLSSLMTMLLLNGQYFVLSLHQSRENLGVYFFGIQLAISMSMLASQVINQVFFPRFSHHAKYKDKHKEVVVRALCVTIAASSIVAIVFYFIADFIISWIWAGKWDDSIQVFKWIVLCIPASLSMTLVTQALSSLGLWRLRFYILFTRTIADLSVVAIASYYGDIYDVALYLSH